MTEKRIALITGAAKGLGKEISKQLASEDYFILAVDLDEENLNKLITELDVKKSEYFKADVSSEKEADNLFNNIKEKYSRLDVLVNNAGIIKDNMIHKMETENFDSVVSVNLKGSWLMCRGAAKIMREQKYGRIINISSRAWLGNPGQTNYSASKAGIIGLTRSLALELGKYNVTVNAIAPGLIDTPLTRSLPQDVLEKLISAQPTKSIGKPEDVANAVSFLASEKTGFITGQVIYVDGGKSIGANLI